jgi:2-iminobutanoate/2-iminopropanoate deaminase
MKEVEINVIGQVAESYAQAVEITHPRRWLYISGQVPSDPTGHVPTEFVEQAKLVWQNVFAQLKAAEMSIRNLVKVTVYLSDRRYRALNAEVRHEVLNGHSPALTVIIATIFDEAWLIEIEAVAVA